MTEEQIEARVERYVDHLDRLLMAGAMSQKSYTAALRDLHDWADARREESERQQLYRRRAK